MCHVQCVLQIALMCTLFVLLVSNLASRSVFIQVILNGTKLPVKTFQDYVNLYLGPGTQRVYEKLGERWEVCISLAEQGQFQQV